MRKLIVSMNVTLDGFLSGPHGELDWHFQSWTGDMADALCMQMAKADTLLLGRVTYTAMCSYWQAKAMDLPCCREDLVFADMMNHYTKVVVSRSLARPPIRNSVLMNGNIGEGLLRLKQQSGKDIIIFGSGQLLATLLPISVIDEYLIWIHPVTIGKGKSLFGDSQQRLKLIRAETFCSGVVLLSYQSIHYDRVGA